MEALYPTPFALGFEKHVDGRQRYSSRAPRQLEGKSAKTTCDNGSWLLALACCAWLAWSCWSNDKNTLASLESAVFQEDVNISWNPCERASPLIFFNSTRDPLRSLGGIASSPDGHNSNVHRALTPKIPICSLETRKMDVHVLMGSKDS